MSLSWIDRIFEAKAAKNGGVVRRKATSVEKYASVEDLTAEVKRRKYHMVLHGGQYIIYCDPTASTQIIC